MELEVISSKPSHGYFRIPDSNLSFRMILLKPFQRVFQKARSTCSFPRENLPAYPGQDQIHRQADNAYHHNSGIDILIIAVAALLVDEIGDTGSRSDQFR